jgi:tRNA pseudouridine38-40 synthase
LPTWKLTLEYDGTRYHGWQEQRNVRTVAGIVRAAAEKLLGNRVELGGAGRTDSGVHALAQVAHLRAGQRLRDSMLSRGLNDLLPADINILKAEAVAANFDARRDAIGRYYLYQISTRRTAFAKQYVWWIKDRLDVDRMRSALECLQGRHSFAAFCEQRPDEKSWTVEVNNVEMRTDGDLVLIRIGASHFLWKMVRRVVGMLVEVGREQVSVDEFRGLLSPLSRGGKTTSQPDVRRAALDVAAHTAPPSGLFLERVVYVEKDRDPKPLVAAFHVGSRRSNHTS